MLLKTRGIVVRSTKYGETSLILDIYTLDRGRQSYIINSVRTPKARVKQSIVNLASFVDLVVYQRDQKNVNRIKEVKPAQIYTSIPFDVIKGTVALFMVELIEKTIKESESNPALFEFVEHSFVALDQVEKASLFPLVFPILLMPYLGFSPGNDWSENTPYFDIRESLFVKNKPLLLFMDEEKSRIFASLLQTDLRTMDHFSVPKNQRNELLNHVLEYYQCHVENFKSLNSHVVLREVLG